jgi:type III secretory pathway lipoprotein EscJ
MALVAAPDFDRWKTSARRFADGFTPGQKAVTAVAIIAVVIGGLMFMSFAGAPTYAPLFTGLQPQDAASITAKLAAANVPYQLQAGGTSILVPAGQVDQERIDMAQAGLPASSTNVGLGILDKEGITTSQMTQQADYLRALQGELEQTIGAIHGVTGVQINLAMPANNTFALANSSPTGASVLVDTGPGQTITGGQVQAIVHLVASSVPGLNASDVTVADSNGNQLAGPGVDTTQGDRQQLGGSGPRRDVEGDQSPVPVRGKPGEDLVELLVADGPRNPGRHRGPVETTALVAMRFHRVVVCVGPAAPPSSVQGEGVEQWTAALVAVEVVEAAQHRLAVGTDRGHRFLLAGHSSGVYQGGSQHRWMP